MTIKTKQQKIEELEENLRIVRKDRDEIRENIYDIKEKIKALENSKTHLESDSQRDQDNLKKSLIKLDYIMEILATTVSPKSRIEVLEGIFKEEMEYRRNVLGNNRRVYSPIYP